MKNDMSHFKDEFVASILKNANSKSLPSDFENKIMNNIRSTYSYKKEVKSALKKSMVFFFIATLSIGIYALVVILGKPFFSRTIIVIPTLFLFFSIVITYMLTNNYKRIFQSTTNSISEAL